MSELRNPHDRFFKETFSRIEVARDFFANYLPEEVTAVLDLDTLELQPGSFIDPELQEQFADLLYRVELVDGRVAYLYLLLEHKSHPDPLTPFQALRYEMRIWERDVRAGEGLRPIVPVVVYHGQEKWRVATDFAGLFDGPEALRRYWPTFQYDLHDLSALSDEEVQGAAQLQIGLLILKYIFDPALRGRLVDIFNLFHDLAETKSALEYLGTVLYYVGMASKHLSREDIVVAVRHTLEAKGNEVMQTAAEQWIAEGFDKGVKQGIEHGRMLMLQEDILDLLYARFELASEEVAA
ncbi:MAG TPA: Rpn family recombination-promoting nuclease/putative transposase, partial [Chloroflexota bacterium]|nr:Rpn family recombination-promoting nuclease/putative transposase [Chloroflexota bacterium]